MCAQMIRLTDSSKPAGFGDASSCNDPTRSAKIVPLGLASLCQSPCQATANAWLGCRPFLALGLIATVASTTGLISEEIA